MIVTLAIPPESLAKADADAAYASRVFAAAKAGVLAAVSTGADVIALALQQGELGVTPQHGGMGLAGSVQGWLVDESIPAAAVGVPSNVPASAYASILNYGGVIRPRNAKALAVPVSPQARRSPGGPRDMANLFLMRRPGRPPLLIEAIHRKSGKQRGQTSMLVVHWVLLQSVTIPAFAWFDRGAELADKPMAGAFRDAFSDAMEGPA